MKKEVTIHDVAAAAGVSAGTVHRALYGKPGVSAALRQEILRLSDEMHYQPGPTPAMRSRRTPRIVVALPGRTRENSFFFSRMWAGCRQQFEDLATYHLDVVEAPFDDTQENGFAASLARVFRQYRGEIDGLVAGGRIFEDSLDALARVLSSGLPTVLVNETFSGLDPLCTVRTDCFTEGRLAAELLERYLGPDDKVLLCAGDGRLSSNRDTVAGFESRLRVQRPETPIIRIHGYSGVDGTYETILRTLEADEHVRGLFSVNLRCSLMLARAVQRLHLQNWVFAIGSDLCDESAQALRRGELSCLISKDPAGQGRLAVEQLTGYLLHHKEPMQKTKFLHSELIFQSNLEQFL